VTRRLRIFVSSPGDVTAAREIAALTIEGLAQNYARFFAIEPYLWEFEAMLASGHFQDSIEPPSAFDVVVLIVWSRLGTSLPERTAVREYRGIDGRTPVSGSEWEFEEALQAAQRTGAPDLLVYRSLKPAAIDTEDPRSRELQLQQLQALDAFWGRHFANQGRFIGAYTAFRTDAEFAAAFENHLCKLIERRIAALGSVRGDAPTRAWAQAPFRGLEAYEFEHAPIFFGQDEALAKAMLQLTGNAEAGSPFLMVLGASGSGKSSLVKAGALPKLFVPRRIAATAFLRRVVFRPSDAREGEDLFDALARRLVTQVSEQEGLSELLGHGQSPASLAVHLRNATTTPAYPIATALGQLTLQARQSGRMLDYESAKLVLVVDQLEELFTGDRRSPAERAQFVELLAGLVRSGCVWVVATMRKDFWHRADETPELVRMSEGTGRLELLPPAPAQLSQMIRRPAEAAGVSFEVHATTNVPLNEVIAEEVAREPGALPLLSYLLDQLYRADVLEAHGTTLTYATYQKLGKLEGAIATQAEAVLERCAPEDAQALGSVLFFLAEIGAAEGNVGRAIARRVPLSTFPAGSPQRRLVEALLDPGARLLVSDTEQGGSPTVRVAHEALISRWARAREYVQGNALALKIRHRIEERYVLWRGLKEGDREASHRQAGSLPRRAARLAAWRARLGREQGLLSDIDLTDGRRLLKEHRTDTEPHLVAYIDRSVADNQRIHTRTVRVLAAVASVVTLLAVLALGAGWIASQKQHEAEYQAAETLKAQSGLLVEAAGQRLNAADVAGAQGIILEVLTNPGFAQGHTPAAISVFQEIRAADAQLAVLSGHGDFVNSAAYSPDGTRIVTASFDQTARIWDARTGTQLAVLSGHGGIVASAAYSPDGTRIVTASGDQTARIWDVRTGAQLVVLSGHGAIASFAAYSPDGTRIITASDDQTARIWNARVPANIATQILWDAAAETDPLPDADRTQLGLLPDERIRKWSTHGSACDQAAAAFYDPDRLTAGVAQATIVADLASSACSQVANTADSSRFAYQRGRALLAGQDVQGAKRQFELAVSEGYRAARVDLANLLVDSSAGMLDPNRAALLYEQAWQAGVPVAAFALGQLYENGVRGPELAATVVRPTNSSQAWFWYQKGADAGEPNALARFAERDQRSAIAEADPQKRDALLLRAFSYYSAATERAYDEDWPQDAWRHWRYRRATLARLLAREGLMPQVAHAYQAQNDKWGPPARTIWQGIAARLHL
jgi:TPR repeat protein